MMVSVTSSGSMMAAFDTTPDTVTTSFGSGSSSLTGLILTVPVLPVAFAAKLSVRFVLSVKSSSVAGATGLAEISTVKATGEAGEVVAVTVTLSVSSRGSTSLRCSVTSSPGSVISSSGGITTALPLTRKWIQVSLWAIQGFSKVRARE